VQLTAAQQLNQLLIPADKVSPSGRQPRDPNLRFCEVDFGFPHGCCKSRYPCAFSSSSTGSSHGQCLPLLWDLLAGIDNEKSLKTGRQRTWAIAPQPNHIAVMHYHPLPQNPLGPKFLMTREQPGSRYPAAGGPGQFMNGTSGPVPGARPLLPDNGRIIQSGSTRILCIADVRGKL
jgi:hypothetical protein